LSIALQLFQSTKQQLQDWSWFKRSLLVFTLLTFLVSSFLFLTSPGTDIRIWMANSVIITQHREWAWIFVGTEQRDNMVKKMHQFIEENAEEKQQFEMIKHHQPQEVATRKNRTIDELIKVEDISGTFWKGKRMYVYDPKTIRLMTPAKSGEGEKISAMVKRTGAVAGVNAGGFDDPEGLGNGFAAIGAIISGGEVIYTDQESNTPQHIVGFTKDGTLVIGKYNMFELKEMGISEAASFYPRVIANGKPLPINDVSRAPRTAVAQKADGTVIFIIADGRQANSVGATLKEIQDIFLAEDVINAGFLDGGASSQLVVNGELITKPSSRYGERRLPSAYLVYDHPEDAVANRVWDGLTTINAGGSFDHPDFLKEQAERRAKGITTPSTTKPVEPVKPKTAETGTTTNGTGTTKPADSNQTTKPAQSVDSKSTNDNKTTVPPAHSNTTDPVKEPTKPATNTINQPVGNNPAGAGSAGSTKTNPSTTPGTGVSTPTTTPGATAPVNGNTTAPNTSTTAPAAGDSGTKTLPTTDDSAAKSTTPPVTAPATNDAADKGTGTAPATPPATSDAAVKSTTPVTEPVSDAANKPATPAPAATDTGVKSTTPASPPASTPAAASTTVPAPVTPAAPTTPTAPVKVN
jgi:exopolysaccharide biosynthesis protein